MNTTTLAMEIRSVDEERREIVGVCAPYGETTMLVPNPRGERIMPGAFKRSIDRRSHRVLLFREHDHKAGPIGRSVSFSETPSGLEGLFSVRSSARGDEALADMREGFLPSLSVGFAPVTVRTAADGVTEVLEARLLEVSAVAMGAYEGSELLAVRHVVELDELALPPMPVVDLSPLRGLWD